MSKSKMLAKKDALSIVRRVLHMGRAIYTAEELEDEIKLVRAGYRAAIRDRGEK